MIHRYLRPAEVGLLAALVLVGFIRPVAADPAHDDDAVVSDDDLSYVLFRDDKHTTNVGKTSDIERARGYKQPNERMLWLRDGSHEYVIRDVATLREVETIWRPVEEIGDAQGKIGNKMGEIGNKMGEIGTQQGVLGTRQGALATRDATLSIRESSNSLSDAQRAKLVRRHDELQQQMRALEKQMRALERPMKELETQMEPLSREMEVLGKKIEVAVRKARGELRAVFRRAITSGTARQVK